jgi:cell division FtsZ-interacting protein ZapD
MNKVSNYEKLLEAFEEKKVKTKHLKQKAEKKKAVKKTRAIKRADADKLDALRRDFTRKIEYSLGHIIQTNAKNCEAVSFLKKKMKEIRQTISE